VKGTQAGIILSSGFSELDVVADDADDIRLLLEGVREIAGVRHGFSSRLLETELSQEIVSDSAPELTIQGGILLRKNCGIWGYPVEGLGKSRNYFCG
jgi:hypothetical protein